MAPSFFILTFLLVSSRINAESADSSIVRSNLKRIINNALDALVNLEEDTSEISARTAEMAARESEVAATNEADDEGYLTSEIRELENLLMADKKEVGKGKAVEAFFENVAGEEKKSENEIKSTSAYKRELFLDEVNNNDNKKDTSSANAERGSKSREERARVELDNNDLEDLVDYVVRSIDDEAKRVGESSAGKDAVVKKEVEKAKEEETKKETVEKKSIDKELCNSRKKECVQKETVKKDLVTSSAKKSEEEIVKKAAKSADERASKDAGESNEIREMVDRILDGKSEEEREVFTNLLEHIFEKNDGKSDNEKKKKRSKE